MGGVAPRGPTQPALTPAGAGAPPQAEVLWLHHPDEFDSTLWEVKPASTALRFPRSMLVISIVNASSSLR